jgi:hypothetical protein
MSIIDISKRVSGGDADEAVNTGRRNAIVKLGLSAAAIYTMPILLNLSEAVAAGGGGGGGGGGDADVDADGDSDAGDGGV